MRFRNDIPSHKSCVTTHHRRVKDPGRGESDRMAKIGVGATRSGRRDVAVDGNADASGDDSLARLEKLRQEHSGLN